MPRLSVSAACLFLVTSVLAPATSGQAVSVLHVKVVLVDAQQKPTPVARHVLLVSDNPASAPPRQIITALDGAASVRLRPGRYTVESDQPVAFLGKAYQWTEMVDVVAGRDAVLELTAVNAEVGAVTAATSTTATPLATDPSFLLREWMDSVVVLWTPTMRASGFVVDAKGLVVTTERVIGTSLAVEVQITPAVKVAARVLAADRARDVAVLWIDPDVAATVRPVPLGCAPSRVAPVVDGEEIWTIGAPLGGPKRMASGTASRIEARVLMSDFFLGSGAAGGPVFSAGGSVVGITTIPDDSDRTGHRGSPVVRIGEVCDVVASAEKKMKDAVPPSAAHLPVEPERPFPVPALEDAAKRRAGSLNPYQMSSTDFDVAFITPVLIYGSKYQSERASGRERGRSTSAPVEAQGPGRSLQDFSTWSEYVADFPPVLLVRVTPKFVEGFWTTVGRVAASTQGVSLPPIKRYKSGFSRLRAFCGDAEVTPIHPFTLEQRISESDAIHEGLYVFDPGALGPHCATVKFVLYAEKAPEKGDTRVVDPKVIEQIWQDFAPYRAAIGASIF